MVQRAERAYSVGDYFCIEQMSDIKHEYYAGAIYALAGASTNHNRITRNLLIALGNTLHDSSCETFTGDQRICTPAGLYTYPDMSVICGEIEYTHDPLETATNPTVLVEVLSASTRRYDQGEKFEFYRAIPTLRHYLLIEQTQMQVEHRARREDGIWVSTVLTGPEAVLDLPDLNFRTSLQEIYARVELEDSIE